MNIGQAAAASAVSAKMIRHYEALGLLPKVPRTEAGYRQYDDASVHALRFIRRARDMGFSMEQVAELVSLWHNRRRTSATVKRIAQNHLDELDQRIAAMQGMRHTLSHLMHCCQGDQRPDCPILEDLAGLTSS